MNALLKIDKNSFTKVQRLQILLLPDVGYVGHSTDWVPIVDRNVTVSAHKRKGVYIHVLYAYTYNPLTIFIMYVFTGIMLYMQLSFLRGYILYMIHK